MNSDQQQQLVNNIAGGLSQCSAEVQERMLPHFDKVRFKLRKNGKRCCCCKK